MRDIILDMGERVGSAFYSRNDVLTLSKELLGMKLISEMGGIRTSGMIVETEAYIGSGDKASHAYGSRRTKRTETMYAAGGKAYIYLCYGVHHLFNIVVGDKDDPLAILVRGIEPLEGIELMLQRRKKKKLSPLLTNGPGKLTKALGITTAYDKIDLATSDKIWIERSSKIVPAAMIEASTRIGVGYAEEHALLPYRFTLRGNPYVSK